MLNLCTISMVVIQNCTKPYKSQILSTLRPLHYCCVSVSFPLYFQSGGIVCTDFYGRKVSTALNSYDIFMTRKYIGMLVKIYSWEKFLCGILLWHVIIRNVSFR